MKDKRKPIPKLEPELRAALAEQVVVSRDPLPLAELSSFPMSPLSRFWKARFLGSGDLLLAAACDAWVFLWIADLESGTIHTRVSLPAPEGDLSHFRIGVDGDTLWVVGYFYVQEVSLRDWQIRSWRCYREFVPDDALVEWGRILPHSHHLWAGVSFPESASGIYVIDLRAWTLARPVLALSPWVAPLVGSAEPFFFFLPSDEEEGPLLYRPDGSPLAGSDLPLDYWTVSLAVAPHDAGGYVAMELVEVEDEDADGLLHDLNLRLFAPGARGSFQAAASLTRRVIHGPAHRGLHELAVSRRERLCFFLVRPWRGKDRQHLLAVSVTPRGFRLRYRVRMPFDTRLVWQPGGERVVAVFTAGRGVEVLPLGRRPPALDHLPEEVYDRAWLDVPSIELDATTSCGAPRGSDGKGLHRPLSQDMKRMKPRQRRQFVGHYLAGFGDDADELVTLYHALRSIRLQHGRKAVREIDGERRRVFALLMEHHRDHPAAALVAADEEARGRNWEEVGRWLRVADAGGGFKDDRRYHLEHLRGLALLHAGRSAEAFAAFEKAAARRWGRCRVRPLLGLTAPMADPPRPDEWGPDQPMLRQLLGAIRTANRALAAGDFPAVAAALDRPAFWQESEVQTAARLAVAHLGHTPRTAAGRLAKRFALAHFCEAQRRRVHRHDIRLPGVTWDSAELERVKERARAWLDAGLPRSQAELEKTAGD